MNFAFGAALLLIVGGAGIYILAKPQPADEFPVDMATAYHRLASAELSHGHKGPFGGLSTRISGNGRDSLEWSAGGTFAAFDCKLALTPLGEARTKVAVSCEGGGGGAAEGMLTTMTRDAVIEQIDSTLKGRAYDIELAKGATAYRWPEDTVHHAGFRESVGNAIKMQADIADEQAKMEQEHKANEVMHDSANVGQPSVPDAPVEPQPAPDT